MQHTAHTQESDLEERKGSTYPHREEMDDERKLFMTYPWRIICVYLLSSTALTAIGRHDCLLVCVCVIIGIGKGIGVERVVSRRRRWDVGFSN